MLFLLPILRFQAQSVNDLNQSAKSFSGGSSGGSSSSNGSSDPGSLNPFFLVETIWFMGRGFVLLIREQERLARRNKAENHLFGLEARVGAGTGFSDFVRMQPQARLHLGWLSLDWRQTLLKDRKTEFHSRDLFAWFNFVNHPKFRLRAGTGSYYLLSTRDQYFTYGGAMEIQPATRWTVEAWGTSTQAMGPAAIRPRWELGVRVQHHFWQKGIGRASIFGGYAMQEYFNTHRFATADLGLQFFVSFSRFNERFGAGRSQ